MKKEPNTLLDALEEPKKQARHTWTRLGILMVLLLAAGVLLWQKAPGGGKAPAPAPTPAQTVGATPAPTAGRTARELAFDKDRSALEKLVGEEKVEEGLRQQAAKQLAQMIADHQTELGIEEALNRSGFSPSMVLLQNGALTVTVESRELTATESATILSVCVAHSEVAVENIRIMTGETL